MAASASRFNDSSAFDYSENPVHRWNSNLFLYPAWPLDLEFVDFGCRTQAKVQARIGTGRIAATADNIASLTDRPGGNKHLCSDGVTWAFRTAHRPNAQPVIGVADDIAE